MSDKKIKILKISIIVFCVSVFILLITNESYALFNKNVKTGVNLKITTLDKMPNKYATDTIKATLGKTGGVIGVTNVSEPTTIESSNIREYRYSGLDVNNYIYFNCQDGTTYETSSSNCEIWRIVGVFKDEEGIEHLKIVKNDVLSETKKWKSSSPYSNDWTSSTINSYLNTTYYNTLSTSSKNIIEETKYYLGTIKQADDDGYGDNTKTSYTHEKEIGLCRDNTGFNAEAAGCRVWSDNKATWIGNIALLYPSDYGFSASSNYWNSILWNLNDTEMASSWLRMNANHSNSIEWLLSPSATASYYGTCWSGSNVGYTGISVSNFSVRPCLYLKSNLKITNGKGELNEPYYVEI